MKSLLVAIVFVSTLSFFQVGKPSSLKLFVSIRDLTKHEAYQAIVELDKLERGLNSYTRLDCASKKSGMNAAIAVHPSFEMISGNLVYQDEDGYRVSVNLGEADAKKLKPPQKPKNLAFHFILDKPRWVAEVITNEFGSGYLVDMTTDENKTQKNPSAIVLECALKSIDMEAGAVIIVPPK